VFASPRGVDDIAADNGHLATGFQNFGFGKFHDVGGEDGEIGEFAFFNEPFSFSSKAA